MKMWKRMLALCLCLCALLPFAAACAEGDEALLQDFALHHGDRNSKKIALTVDDCYKSATEWIEKDIELCKEYGVKMTFFPLYKTGCLTEKYRDLWQSVLDAGCEIGCHGYQHVYYGALDSWTLIKRLGRWQEELDKTLGYHYATRWARPPYGSLEDKLPGKKGTTRVIKALKTYGYEHIIHWDVSETKNFEKALTDVQNGSILLFHAKKKDSNFMEKLIPALQEMGYEMVTVSELFGFDPPEISDELYVYDRANYEDK